MLPNSVTEIGAFAFRECVNLTSINIPESISEIKECTFDYCENLENIIISDSVKKIGYFAFFYCTNLKSILIPESVVEIDKSAFGGCEDLHIHGYKDSVAERYAKENNISFISIDNNESEKLNLKEKIGFGNISDLKQNEPTNLDIEDKFEKIRKVLTTQSPSQLGIQHAKDALKELSSLINKLQY